MIVVGELEPRFGRDGTRVVEQVSGALPVVKAPAQLFWDPAAYDETLAERARLVERLRPVALEETIVDMRGRRCERVPIEEGLHRARRSTKQARKFDLAIADAGNLRQCSLEVAREKGAHGVELKADRQQGFGIGRTKPRRQRRHRQPGDECPSAEAGIRLRSNASAPAP
jgi:hypothetical protein